jgi:L-arabinokinase
VASVFFYISGHGFGHVSREIEVVNALAAACPDVSIVVRTAANRTLFDRTVRAPFTLIDGPCDTGVVQIDSLRLDEEATIGRAAEFHRQLPRLAAQEAVLLREHDARFVVADTAPLAPVAASAAGVPSVVLANFTWDWIYEGYPEALTAAPDLIPIIRDAYRHAGDAWRLPLHGGFTMFDRPVDLPFIARRGTRDRLDVRRLLRLPADRPLALSSFGGYGLRDFDLRRLDCLDEWGIVITGNHPPGPLPAGVQFIDEGGMYGSGVRYEDLVASVDVVVTKPGFGIVTECLANGTAMLYTSRGRFVEYEVMVAEMPRFLRCAHIELEELRAGRWLEGLTHVRELPPPPERPRTDGADVVAGMIRERLEQ